MRIIISFFAGFFATLLFHQPALGLLRLAGLTDRTPYTMDPTVPFGVPAVISLAFWGGLWGIALWLLIRNRVGSVAYWGWALVFGAVAPTLVAGLVVAPIKGQPLAGGGSVSMIVMGLSVNAAWGLGTALMMRATGSRVNSER
jgi:hypothetical protein